MAYHVEQKSLGSLEAAHGSADPEVSIAAYLAEKEASGLELVGQCSGPSGIIFTFKGHDKKVSAKK